MVTLDQRYSRRFDLAVALSAVAAVCQQAPWTAAQQCESAASITTCAGLGWIETFGSTSICAESEVGTSSAPCLPSVPFTEAVRVCHEVGARLCTLGELTHDEARGTGCGFDGVHVWSGTRGRECAEGEVMVAPGKVADGCSDVSLLPRCASILETREEHAVRCCADEPQNPCFNQPGPLPSLFNHSIGATCFELARALATRLYLSTSFYTLAGALSPANMGHCETCAALLTCRELGWPTVPTAFSSGALAEADLACPEPLGTLQSCLRVTSYSQAVTRCSALGARICTVDELLRVTACDREQTVFVAQREAGAGCSGGRRPALRWLDTSEHGVPSTVCVDERDSSVTDNLAARCCAEPAVAIDACERPLEVALTSAHPVEIKFWHDDFGSVQRSPRRLQPPGWQAPADGRGLNCRWILSCAADEIVQVNFTAFETEQDFDFVSVFDTADGDPDPTDLVENGHASGLARPPILFTRGHRLLIVFESDTTEESRGFSVEAICRRPQEGCTDVAALNFQASATYEQPQSCRYANSCLAFSPCLDHELCVDHHGAQSCACISLEHDPVCSFNFNSLAAAVAQSSALDARPISYMVKATRGNVIRAESIEMLRIMSPKSLKIAGQQTADVDSSEAVQYVGQFTLLDLPDGTGGAHLELENLVIRNQISPDSAANGGVIENHGGTVVVSGSYLTQNAAKGFGGVCWGGATSSMEFVRTAFVGNNAMQSGGAISSQGVVQVHSCHFAANRAISGGAIHMDPIIGYTTTLAVFSSVFIHNSAFLHGGGSFMATGGNVRLDNCSFSENRARGLDETGGGAGFLSEATLLITNSSFNRDYARAAGDELFLYHVASWNIRQTTLSPFVEGQTIYKIGSSDGGCQSHPCQPGMQCQVINGSITCQSCSQGEISRLGLSCDNCDPGTGPADQGRSRSACANCPRGTYSDYGNCKSCQHNHQPSDDQKMCVLSPCPPGTVKDAQGQRCVKCPEGQYNPHYDQPCESCVGGSTPSHDRTRCFCPSGSYNQSNGIIYCHAGGLKNGPLQEAHDLQSSLRTICVPCPSCANCSVQDDKNIVHVEFGYSVSVAQYQTFAGLQSSTTTRHEIRLFTCPRPEACLGEQRRNNDDAFYIQCRAGHTGVLCATCKDNYAMQRGLCTPCTSGGRIGPVVLLLLLGAGAVLIVGFLFHGLYGSYCRRRCRQDALDNLLGQHTVENPASGSENWAAHVTEIDSEHPTKTSCTISQLVRVKQIFRYFFHPVRIVISFSQVIVQLGPVLHVQYPAKMRAIIDALKPIMFNLRNYIQVDCWIKHNFWFTWTVNVFIIPGILFATIGVWHLHRAVNIPVAAKTQRRNLQHSARGYIFSVVFLVYPSVCNNVFVIFRCRTLTPNEKYMEVDYTVSCDDHTYFTFAMVSSAVAVVVFFVPVKFWLMMRNEQKKERDDDPALVQLVRRVEHELELNDGSAVQVVKQIQMDEEFSFLLDAYRPDYYYWECVDMLRKLIIIGLLVLVDRGSILQIYVAICISFVFFALHVKTWPYKASEDNWLKATTEVSLFIVIMVSIVLRADLAGESVGKEFYDYSVVLSFILLVPSSLVAAILCKVKAHHPTESSMSSSLGRLDREKAAFERFQKAATPEDRVCLQELFERLSRDIEEQDVTLSYTPLSKHEICHSPLHEEDWDWESLGNMAARTQAILDRREKGRWRLAKEDRQCVLGVGAASSVFKFEDKQQKTCLAIKVILSSGIAGQSETHPQPFSNRQMEDLEQEAKRLRQFMSHTNIVSCTESFHAQGRTAFMIVMELLSEGSLFELLGQRQFLSENEASSITLDILMGLKFVHDKGFVHRNINPKNLCAGYCNREGTECKIWKIVDFGMTESVAPTATFMSSFTSLPETRVAGGPQNFGRNGEPHYISPEVYVELDDIVLTPKMDIWAVGVTMYEMLGGCKPFAEGQTNRTSIMRSIISHSKPEDLRDLVSRKERLGAVSDGMAEAVKRALTKDPQLRLADATEMLENLKEILASDDEKIYHVFISYRVATEAAFAAELFRKLSQELVGSYKERMIVYLDRVRLLDGKKFDEGFMQGLGNSMVFVPLVSPGVLLPFTEFRAEQSGWFDFVLLEWMMALELHRQGKIKAILPLFMGPTLSDGSSGNFFEWWSEQPALANSQAPKLVTECRRYLEKTHLQDQNMTADYSQTYEAVLKQSITETLTVKKTVDEMCNFQAVVFHNDQDIQNEVRRNKPWNEARLEVSVQRVTKLVNTELYQLEKHAESQGALSRQKSVEEAQLVERLEDMHAQLREKTYELEHYKAQNQNASPIVGSPAKSKANRKSLRAIVDRSTPMSTLPSFAQAHEKAEL